ncbi:urease accessory protein UreE [Citricoccus sp. NPDC079358]|uniref:Urease accessory protein UreE n=1 Tax=Citricoccus muralis TaxID=169134 RepID=A0A3D9LEU3_9MICC|nr:urease accessory protein UreE [Citricoccus muralis]REE04194.1 urease accessory protein [Citricoccus muralis]
MIIESVLFNLTESTPDQRSRLEGVHLESVLLTGAALTQRIQRLTTDHGRDVGLRLPSSSPDLRNGDVLALDEGGAIVVSVLPTDVLVIAPADLRLALFTAHSLGNRHLQAQFLEKDEIRGRPVMVVQYDHTVQAFLDAHAVPYDRRELVMPEPFRHAEHTH